MTTTSGDHGIFGACGGPGRCRSCADNERIAALESRLAEAEAAIEVNPTDALHYEEHISMLEQENEKLRTQLAEAREALEHHRCKEHSIPHNGSETMDCESCYIGEVARAALAKLEGVD